MEIAAVELYFDKNPESSSKADGHAALKGLLRNIRLKWRCCSEAHRMLMKIAHVVEENVAIAAKKKSMVAKYLNSLTILFAYVA